MRLQVDFDRAACSGGGPLILLARSHMPAWDGVRDSVGRQVEARFRFRGEGSRATDYDRACDVAADLGILSVDLGEALVLGDESLPTHIALVDGAADEVVLVGWEYAPDEEAAAAALRAVRAVRAVRAEHFGPPAVEWTIADAPQALFDSAVPGDELHAEEGHLTLDLPAGRYGASTFRLETTEDVALRLDWLRPLRR